MLSLTNVSDALGYKTVVNVTNTLGGGLNLNLHCLSADDDLGAQQLLPRGSAVWRFKVNFFATTLFHCSFQWNQVLHKFVIYDASRDDPVCRDYCQWNIYKNGPCLSKPRGETDCYTWN
ncbi:hypothetical protein VNO78_15307 [Psophocarpus tetragonolobus]|uniref:S-protein homolog n=1 Tax=Psophocarpus tetragonolobus TaxID=3891 RepID=A0AAN9XJS9_PSOTE